MNEQGVRLGQPTVDGKDGVLTGLLPREITIHTCVAQHRRACSSYHIFSLPLLTMAVLDLVLQHPVIAVAASILIALVISSARLRSTKNYPDLPWVGKKSNAFGAATYANFTSVAHTREWLTEGYNKVSPISHTWELS